MDPEANIADEVWYLASFHVPFRSNNDHRLMDGIKTDCTEDLEAMLIVPSTPIQLSH